MIMPMDRAQLSRFLQDPGTTLRWAHDRTDGYQAVEIREGKLRWYRWSHDLGRAEDEIWQTQEQFQSDGPARPAPPRVLAAVEASLSRSGGPDGDALVSSAHE